jgi:hypothetical protein
VIDGRIPKQSSLLSLPRKMAGDVKPDELDWDKTVSGSWLCIYIVFIILWDFQVWVEKIRNSCPLSIKKV